MRIDPRTSSATLELPEDTLVMLSFHFLFTRKPTCTCLSIVGLRVVQQVATLESCETFLFSSEFSEPYHVPFHVVFFQFFFQLSHVRVHLLVMFLHCMLQFSVALPLLVWWFSLTHIFLAPPVCSLGGPGPPPMSQTSMLLGALAYLYFACWLLWPTLPRWPMRV